MEQLTPILYQCRNCASQSAKARSSDAKSALTQVLFAGLAVHRPTSYARAYSDGERRDAHGSSDVRIEVFYFDVSRARDATGMHRSAQRIRRRAANPVVDARLPPATEPSMVSGRGAGAMGASGDSASCELRNGSSPNSSSRNVGARFRAPAAPAPVVPADPRATQTGGEAAEAAAAAAAAAEGLVAAIIAGCAG